MVIDSIVRCYLRPALLLACCAGLSACVVQSKVQGRYIEAQEQCRENAETIVEHLPNADKMTPAQQSAETVNQFSGCMNQAGWHVANPLKPKGDKTATNTDAGIQPAERSAASIKVGAPPAAAQGQSALRAAAAPQQPPARAAAPTIGNPTAQPSDIAPPARYERGVDSPSSIPSEDRNGRQF